MRLLTEGDFKNKRVLVRCDFNVALDGEGRVVDDFRIAKTLPTIKFLLKKGAAVILMSHLERDGKPASLEPVLKHLENILLKKIVFVSGYAGAKAAKIPNLGIPGQVALLENLRFNSGEKAADDKFARDLAALADCYVNDAFSCSHRRHASITGVPKYLPSWPGLLMSDEIANLSRILKHPERPFVVIIGGAKVGTKSKTIANIVKIADHILIGSRIGEKILVQKQQMMGRQSKNEVSLDFIDLTSPKIHLPIDGVLTLKDNSEGYLRTAAIGMMRVEEEIYDIGPETVKFFSEIIKDAKTIFLNGPMGLFEDHEFAAGTRAIIEAVSRVHGAYRVAGGGETLVAIHKYNADKKFDFLSTGGGAMLEYLAGNELPGIAALENSSQELLPSLPVPVPPGKKK